MRPPVLVEQLLGPVAAHPRVQGAEMIAVRAHLGQRDLVGAPRSLDGKAVDLLRSRPPLGRAQDDHRPPRPRTAPPGTRVVLDVVHFGHDVVERLGQRLVHHLGLLALHDPRRPAAAPQQVQQLLGLDAGEHGRVGDLVAVEVEDGEDGAVVHRVEELGGVPARRERTGLGLAVADHAHREQVGIVEHGTERVGQ